MQCAASCLCALGQGLWGKICIELATAASTAYACKACMHRSGPKHDAGPTETLLSHTLFLISVQITL